MVNTRRFMIEDTTQQDDDLLSGDDLATQALADANQTPAPPQKTSNPAALGEALTSLQNVIERNADELDRIKEEMHVQREALKNIFENDEKLNEATQEARS